MADGHRDVVRRERWTRTRRHVYLHRKLCVLRVGVFAFVSNARDAAPPKQSIVLTKDDAGGYGNNLPSHYVAAINTDGGYDYGLTTQCGECWEILCVDGRQRLSLIHI